MLLTLGIREVLPATPRARIVHLDLNGAPFEYVPGQAVLVGSPGWPRRPYSLAAPPEEAQRNGCIELLVAVLADGTPGPHLTLEAGRMVEVEGPLGSFSFPSRPAERRLLFIAGGTGIAPLRAMLRHALTVGGHRIGLFCSARTPDEFAYKAELQRLAATGHIELLQTVTRTVDDTWGGTRGRIGRDELRRLIHDPAGTLCFICGPPALVAEMRGLLEDLGVNPSRIRIDE